MKIALSQLNYHIGNFKANSEKIIEQIERAKKENVDLIIFSELAVCGYPPYDLLERREFVESCFDAINEIAKHCHNIAAIVGAPSINFQAKGKKLYNSAYFLQERGVAAIVHKTLLPNYDIFDEYRYFEPNKEFDLIKYKGKRIAITICEDLWDAQPVANSFGRDKLYTISPMEKLAPLKPDFVVNIAASPFSYNKGEIRREIVAEKSKSYNLPFFYVNQIGANTEIIFDGNSMVVNAKGEMIHELADFKEDYYSIDLEELEEQAPIPLAKPEKIASIYDALLLGIKDYFGKMGFKSATLGLSGGIDSAVTVALAAEALGNENVRVLLLPSQYSSDHSIKDAVDLANNLKIAYEIVPIKDIFGSVETAMQPLFKGLPSNLTEENMQARIRGLLLMALSNKFGNILLNTSNKSEAAVGYGTLYGDMCGGLSVLGDVYKTDVFALARYINRNGEIIPENSISKPPSAELRPDQKDSDSLPEYPILDDILFRYIELNQSFEEILEAGHDIATVEKTVRLVNMNEYKRFQTPPILRVSSKAFGIGRRIPLVAKLG